MATFDILIFLLVILLVVLFDRFISHICGGTSRLWKYFTRRFQGGVDKDEEVVPKS